MTFKIGTAFSTILSVIGPRLAGLSAVSLLLGFALFCIEIFFLLLLKVVAYRAGWLQDEVFTHLFRGISNGWILTFFILTALSRGAVRYSEQFLVTFTHEKFREELRNRVSQSVILRIGMPISTADEFFHLKVERASQCLSYILQSLSQIGYLSVACLSLIHLSPNLTVLSLLIITLLLLPLRPLLRRSAKLGAKSSEKWGVVSKLFHSSLRNIPLFQIANTQNMEVNRISHALHSSFLGNLRFKKNSNIVTVYADSVVFFTLSLLIAGIVWLNLLPAALGFGYVIVFVRASQHLANLTSMLSNAAYLMPNMTDFSSFDRKNKPGRDLGKPIDSLKKPTAPVHCFAACGIRFENISFSYSEGSPLIFDNFSCLIQPGAITLLRGRSGSGKSTFLKLLLGTEKISSGKIKIVFKEGEVCLSDDGMEDCRHYFGYVGREAFLFEGTVRDNLCYGMVTKPTEAEIFEAIARSGCHFLNKKRFPLDERIEEFGQGFSEGEKQRLSFARAILKKPSLLMLDEPTANLDQETERSFMNELLEMRGSAIIIIASHSPLVAQKSDFIVELEGES